MSSETLKAQFYVHTCFCVPVAVKHVSSPLDTTERHSNSAAMTMKVRRQAQIKEDGFTLLLAALVMLETAAHTL